MTEDMNKFTLQTFVLIVEHDPELRKIMEISLKQVGVKVTSVSRYPNALKILEQKSPDIFVVDFDLRDGDPGRLIAAFRKNPKFNGGLVLVSTANRLEDDWRREHKPDSVIYKPFDIRYLIRLIDLIAQKKEKELV